MANLILNFFVPKSCKHVFLGVSSEIYDNFLLIIRSTRTNLLENHLRFMPPSEARNLVNIANKNGVTLLMSAVYLSK